jgi:hypothetical protein
MASVNKTKVDRSWNGYRIGCSHQNAKVNEEAVRVIRYRHETLKEGYGTLGRRYKLSPSTVRDICYRRTWVHVH